MSVVLLMVLQGFITALCIITLSSIYKYIRLLIFQKQWNAYLSEVANQATDTFQSSKSNDKVH